MSHAGYNLVRSIIQSLLSGFSTARWTKRLPSKSLETKCWEMTIYANPLTLGGFEPKHRRNLQPVEL